jgi:hypothetical protein
MKNQTNLSFCSHLIRLAMVSLLISAPLATVACQPQQAGPEAPVLDSLPEFSAAQDGQLFDDVVDAAALGLELDPTTYAGDRTLRTRAERADIVALVKVTTMTEEDIGGKAGLHLILTPQGEPLAASYPLEPLHISLNINSPSYAPFKQVGPKAAGKTMIALWKRFREKGKVAYHWHIIPNTPEALQAVKEAVALRAFSRP